MEVGRGRTTSIGERGSGMNNIFLLLLVLVILLAIDCKNSNFIFIIVLAILGLGANDKLNFLL